MLQHTQAVETRQGDVKDHQIVILGGQDLVGDLPVRQPIDGVAFFAQGTLQISGQRAVVLDQQQAHGGSIPN